jgi:hypothetical protein
MPRSIDHLTLVAADAAELAAALTRLGFTLDAQGLAVELPDGFGLNLFAPHAPAGSDHDGAATRAFLAGFATRHRGPALLAFAEEGPASFGCAPVAGGEDCGFLLATPHVAAAASHANGALGLNSVTATADNPADYAEFLSKLTGQREMLATSSGLEIKFGGQKLEVLTPPAFAFRFGCAAPDPDGLRLAGLSLRVASLELAAKLLAKNNILARKDGLRLLIAPPQGVGLAIALEQEKETAHV